MVRILPTLLALCTLLACNLEKSPRAADKSSSNTGAARDSTGSSGASVEVDSGTTPVAGGGAPPVAGCSVSADCPDDRHFCSDEKVCVECLLDAACGEKTPRCEPSAHACVQCLENSDCADDAPFCDSDSHACIQCQTNTDCKDAEHPRCERAQCVSCTKNDDCKHVRHKAICDVEEKSETSGACVECQTHTDCKDARKPQCTDHACVPCTRNNDACAGRRGTTICNLASGEDAGRCVQCTPLNETACGDNVCDPRMHSCARVRKNSAGICSPCVADSQCMTDQRCIELQFKDKVHGNFCLRRMSTGCTRPFTIEVDGSSISGASSEAYCGINESNTTCEAIGDAIGSKACSTDEACGTMQGDGLCRRVGGQNDRCSYPCGISAHCPDGLDCSVDGNYCL